MSTNRYGDNMSDAQAARMQKSAKHQEFLKRCADTCQAMGGLCHTGDYAIVDTRMYDVKAK